MKLRLTILLSAIMLTAFLQNNGMLNAKEIPTVDPSLSGRTSALWTKMHQRKAEGMMIGQHDGVWMEEAKSMEGGKNVVSHISNLTGKLPAVVSYDFMFITNVNNTEGSWHRIREHEIRENIVAADARGLIVTMCWHYNDPYTQQTFYTKELPTNELKEKSFKSILEGGERHEIFKKDLRKVAEFSKSIKDKDGNLVPFIFRPFHEFDGEWFWWGANYNTPDEFKSVWKFMVHYLRDSLQVHNILYAFSPDVKFKTREDYLKRYPGDDYVDILGFDDYEDFKYDEKRSQAAKRRIELVGELAKEKNKLAALTETGYFINRNNEIKPKDLQRMNYILDVLSETHQYLSYAAFWSNGGSVYCVPKNEDPGKADFIRFFEQDFIILNEKH